jgi:hypothetical protein
MAIMKSDLDGLKQRQKPATGNLIGNKFAECRSIIGTDGGVVARKEWSSIIFNSERE